MAPVTPASGQIRTTTYDGIPLNEPFLIQIRDVILRIPVGYIAPWPTQKERGRFDARKSLYFNFWMPDRRYVEVGDLSLVGFRPKERGRGEPPPDASVVRVNDLKLLKAGELGTRSPEQQVKNFTAYPGPSSYSFTREDFGLVRYWRHDWPYQQPEAFLRYRHVVGSDPQINLHCTPPHLARRSSGPGVNPMCIGFVYIESDELSFQIWFSGTNLSRWREYIFAVRDLFLDWRRQ
jgi:hypothetical protein